MKYIKRINLKEIEAIRIESPGSKVKEFRSKDSEQIFLSLDREVRDLQKWKVTADKVSLLLDSIRELQKDLDWVIEIDICEENKCK